MEKIQLLLTLFSFVYVWVYKGGEVYNFAENLRTQLGMWCNGRNNCLHEMAKFEDGEDAEWQAKLKKACDVARDGQSLMRKVDKEHARLRRLAAKS